MANTFTQIVVDSFPQADENPLSSGGNWSTTTATGLIPAQVVGHLAESTGSPSNHGQAWYTGTSFPNDQYAEITINTLATSAEYAAVGVRAINGVDTLYAVVVGGPVGASTVVYLLKRVAGVQTVLVGPVTVTGAARDVYRISILGTALSVTKNGSAVAGMTNITDATLSTGVPAMFLQAATPANATVSKFAAGNIFTGTVSSLSLSSSAVAYPASSTGTVTLSSVAPTGGVLVSLSSGTPGAVTMPASVVVPAGATTATFTVMPLNAAASSVLTASIGGGSSATASITITGTSSSAIGVWVDQGIIVTHAAGNSPLIPNVIFESGAKILSGTVFKMWYTALGASGGTNYAESTDGITWTQYASNPVISSQGYTKIFKNGSTYYAYTSTLGAGLPTAINVYTSTDGLSWTLQKSNAIVAGAAGTWDSAVLVQLAVVDIVNTVWYGYYAGSSSSVNTTQTYPSGLVTSTDGINWTKSSNNPVIPAGVVQTNFTFQKVGSAYYGWTQVRPADIPGSYASLPTDISRYYSTSPTGPWSYLGTPTIYRTTAAEGVGITIGQVADPCLVSANGNLYMFYSIDSSGIDNTTEALGLAIATGQTVAQLVQTNEGVQNTLIPDGLALNLSQLASDNFTRADVNPIGGNWTPTVAGHTAQIVSNAVESSSTANQGDSYWNALTWGADQYSTVTAGTVVSGSYIGPNVRQSTSGANTAYRFAWGGNTGSSGTYFVQQYVAGVYTQLATGSLTVNVGDTLTLTVIGTQVSAYWNQVLVWTGVATGVASGAPGFLVSPATSVSNAKITNWAGGDFADSLILAIVTVKFYSVPDSRTSSSSSPNASRVVQGTSIYDVQVSDNAAVPGVDDRTQGAPVDSRTNIPTNSRKPGTYGPDE